MAILLTGAAGFIGSHTAVELLNAGKEIVVADNLSNAEETAVENIRKITGKDFPFYKADIMDENAMDRVFEEQDIQSVIHFAGYKAVGESVEKPIMYYENNLGTTISLLKSMRKFGCSRIIFSSSATVYGDRNPIPYREDMQTGIGITNPYGWTKYMIERILTDAAAADPDLSVVLLRYFNPIGAHESGLIGEKPNGIPNNLMPYITQTAAGIREKLTIFGNDYPTEDGTCERDFIHVVDLAKGHLAACEYADEHKGTEIFNLGTGHPVSVLELVNAFIRANGVDVPYTFGPRREGDLPAYYADATKAKEVLGWEAEKTIEDMCRDSWRWECHCRSLSEE
ncbi:MAG: UDP-glucose 4-epimerase GalE [Eubacteriales bacterium]|nr:UDP-glucose 4-epimerase GalE [Eubacteriales bacterium]